eukprot:TRINITY_DN12048_c0_g1_i2.p1 TRINITY_DN12048_c0_g1~~TRINITY_DN12048_c0_g1_i2.p1  ORF type:complete len:1201 (-),score=136.40 TRINITY_DN12048_c0_g1_i2:194-3796(-)
MKLPGSLSSEAVNHVATCPPSPRKCHRKQRANTMTAKVFERLGGTWETSHVFSMGLEVQRTAAVETDGCMLAHLPSTSLRTLLQLRDALSTPFSIALDIASSSKLEWVDLFNEMLDALATRTSELSLKNAKCILQEYRPHVEATECADGLKSPRQESTEVASIFVCSVSGYDATQDPLVVLARLQSDVTDDVGSHADNTEAETKRFVVVVLCSDLRDGPASGSAGRELGRALGTTFMCENFAMKARMAAKDSPQDVRTALDAYLGSLTVVPTVRVPNPQADSTKSQERTEYFLADSLVDGMQKHIRNVSGLPSDITDTSSTGVCRHRGRRLSKSAANVGLSKTLYVEMDTLRDTGWKVERRLRQGFELDLASGESKPHLPKASIYGLQEVRNLMTADSVGLDVVAGSSLAAIEAVVSQLRLSEDAAGEVTRLLIDRANNGIRGDTGDSSCQADECVELVNSCSGDEACLLLTAVHDQIPDDRGIAGAFVRLKVPLENDFASTSGTPIRFFCVLVASRAMTDNIVSVGDSLAALVADEDLVAALSDSRDPSAFVQAVDTRLEDIMLLPHMHVHKHSCHHGDSLDSIEKATSLQSVKHPVSKDGFGDKGTDNDGTCQNQQSEQPDLHKHWHSERELPKWRQNLRWVLTRLQKYSVPLVLGVVVAMIWKNVDSSSYELVTQGPIIDPASFTILNYPISIAFLVNDIFMCFFFGLAIKEVTEALLPGGSLSPISRAINPLVATCGGVVGPIVAYLIMIWLCDAAGSFEGLTCTQGGGSGSSSSSGSSSLISSAEPELCPLSTMLWGWGVPTATDISLAWMFALLIFGAGHPAINFLLLLAIVDDAIGMIIIAVFYTPPDHPVEPQWLGLVVLGALMAYGLRRMSVNWWSPYIFLCGPVSWFGLILAHVHPALALVFIVPFMPASCATMRASASSRHLGVVNFAPPRSRTVAALAGMMKRTKTASHLITEVVHRLNDLHDAPLHNFEHDLKLVVDFGMFFFGLSNAGVTVGALGGITLSVIVALLVGKTLGIAGFGLAAHYCGFALPAGVTKTDLFSMSALAGVGLTVALFVANQAFSDMTLRGEAKMGAVLSVLCAGVAWSIKLGGERLFGSSEDTGDLVLDIGSPDMEKGRRNSKGNSFDDDDPDDEEYLDNMAMDEIMEMLWLRRKYAARGTILSMEKAARSVSKSTNQTTPRTPRSSSPFQ